MIKTIFMAGLAILLHSCSGTQTGQQGHRLSATQFSREIKAAGDAVILDVRTAEEFSKGHLENAVNVDWNSGDFKSRVQEMDKSKPVFVYCLSGGRSGSAAVFLRQSGFSRVVEMTGGMMEWRADNLPEVKQAAEAKTMSLEQYHRLLDSEKLVLVDFYAEWCAPCRKMKPYLEKMATELADEVVLVRIDADGNTELCNELKVSALPVLKLYKSTRLVWASEGFVEETKVREQLEKYISVHD